MPNSVNIAEEIDRRRKRLLDMSFRNRLLAFKIGSPRTISIVDKQPDGIFDRLVTLGKSFSFRPAAGSSSVAGNGDMRLDSDSHPSEEWLDHSGSVLQTNLTEAKLEGALKKICTDANTAIQETGVNILYMAFGLLEWYEATSSERQLMAPLILVPVKIEKRFDGRSGRSRYVVTFSGEEVQSNLCLQRRMKQDFGLVIPDLGDEQTPRQYFSAVAGIVARQPRWRVHPEVLVSFFSFTKLFMYLDLDPAKWQGEHSLEKNRVLQRIVAGGGIERDSPTFLGDYEIDGNPQAESIVLADDADSSQHSALCDIMAGKDLVIEGPPGTGKSQTITNAIAAAMAAGKTVLFVSEKLAALDVVRQRMEKLGLAHFCLELHSEGATPQKVFGDLAARLSARFNPPSKVDQNRQQLERSKARLKEYLDICQMPAGPLKEPTHTIFWRLVGMRMQGFQFLKDAAISTDLDHAAFSQRLDVLKELARHVAEIGVPSSHVWFGFNAERISSHNLDKFEDRISELAAVAGTLGDKLRQAAEILQTSAKDLIHFCCGLNTEQLKYLDMPALKDATLFTRLTGQTSRMAALALAKDLQRLAGKESVAARCVQKSIAESESAARETVELIDYPIVSRLQQLKLQAVEELCANLGNLCRLLDKGGEYGEALIRLGHGDPRTLESLKTAGNRHRLVMDKAVESTDELVPGLFTLAAEQRFVGATERRQHLAETRSALAACFELADLPPIEQLRSCRLALRKHAGSVTRIFSKEYRTTRREIKAFLREVTRESATALANRLQELEAWLIKKREFAEDKACSEHFGPLFKGLDSDWRRLEAVLFWAKAMKQHGLGYHDAERLVSARNADPTPLDPQELSDFIDALAKGLTKLESTGAVAPVEAASEQIPLTKLRQDAELLKGILGRLLALSRELRFEPRATM